MSEPRKPKFDDGGVATEVEKVLAPVAKPLEIDAAKKPFVILVVGVNGSGKTTTIGKLAAKFSAEGRKVMLAAGDTFVQIPYVPVRVIATGHFVWTTTLVLNAPDPAQIALSAYSPGYNPCPTLPFGG